MTNTELLVRLRDLHEELSGINIDLKPGEHVDEETVEALGQLVTDVGNLADQAKIEIKPEDLTNNHETLTDRIVEFDKRHPRVREFLTQMTDVLAMMGI